MMTMILMMMMMMVVTVVAMVVMVVTVINLYQAKLRSNRRRKQRVLYCSVEDENENGD